MAHSFRHKFDNRENNSKVLGIPLPEQMNRVDPAEDGIFKSLSWAHLKVGQIVKIRRNEYFPADIVLINSNEPQGIGYVETKNLDGETNLKFKCPHNLTINGTKTDEEMAMFKGVINGQEPNEFLYKFEGNLKFQMYSDDAEECKEDHFETVPLDPNQVLLRGSSLK